MLSLNNGCELRLNASELTGRQYELGKLGIEATTLKPTLEYPYKPDVLSRVKHKLRKRLNFSDLVFAEQGFRFDPKVLDLPTGSVVYGYFQSWKYFEDHKNQVKSWINSKFQETEEYSKFKSLISDCNYVAVHIRRGDYIGREDFHGLTTPEYYAKALDKLGIEKSNVIVCFSDSIEIAQKVLPNCNFYFGPQEINDPVTILRIMSEGRAIVGSNSSLSWWAAYLMEDGKPRIFPKRWFTNADLDTTDLIPPDWQIIS